MGTIVYDKNNKLIFPITDALSTISTASGTQSTVEDDLTAIYSSLSKLSGGDESASNIIVKVLYLKTNTKEESEVKLSENWQESFESPDLEHPYLWKKTTYTYKGDTETLNTTYEIVSADVAEIRQNIYCAKSTTDSPVIKYPTLVDGYGDPILDGDDKEQEDLTAFDNALPTGWSETPVSISPATPYVFMSTRKRVDGLWERFSEPALFGRWAYDSLMEIRYTVTDTSTVPEVNSTSDSPGTIWSTDPPTSFTGYMWAIFGTSVNGVINADESGIRWKGPSLMAIINGI